MFYRYYRTPQNQRGTIKQYDEITGKLLYEFDPATDTTMDVTIDVKEEFVRSYHLMEDSEVKRNNKERKLDPFSQMQYDQAKEDFIKKFREQHGRDPRKEELPEGSHRSFIALDAPLGSDADETVESVTEDKTANFYESEETPASCMEELLATDMFSDRERTIYDCKVRRNMTNEQMGEAIGTSGQYAGRIWNGIVEKIRNNAEMKRFFRD